MHTSSPMRTSRDVYKRQAVDILPFQKRAVNGQPGGSRVVQKRSQIGVVNPHPQNRAHRGLHDLRVEAVGDVYKRQLYDCGFDFTEGLAAVRLGATWHYIDGAGRTLSLIHI